MKTITTILVLLLLGAGSYYQENILPTLAALHGDIDAKAKALTEADAEAAQVRQASDELSKKLLEAIAAYQDTKTALAQAQAQAANGKLAADLDTARKQFPAPGNVADTGTPVPPNASPATTTPTAYPLQVAQQTAPKFAPRPVPPDPFAATATEKAAEIAKLLADIDALNATETSYKGDLATFQARTHHRETTDLPAKITDCENAIKADRDRLAELGVIQ